MATLRIGNDLVTPVIKETVEVVPSYIPMKTIDQNGKLVSSGTTYNSSPATDVGAFALYYAFYNKTGLTTVDLSSLTSLSSERAMFSCFENCTGLTSVDLSGLTSLSGQSAMSNCFSGCTSLATVDLSSLTTVSGSQAMQTWFAGCRGLTSADLSSLTTVSGSMAMQQCFRNCTSLTTVTIGNTAAIDFGTNKNQFQNMFSGCSQNITLNIATTEAVLSQFTGYDTNGTGHHFGCTGVVTINYTAQ